MDSSNQNNPSENNPSDQGNQSQRKGKGRKKIEMVKIEDKTNLQVTFSKQRAGLFKKASELSTLCGAESAIVVFSPGDKAHSFGNPNVETITDRFLNNNNNNNVSNTIDAHQLHRALGNATMRQQNQELSRLEAQLKQEKDRRKCNEKLRKAPESEIWCPPNIDDLNFLQLEELKRSITSFKQQFETKMQNATSMVSSYAQGSGSGSRSNPDGRAWTNTVDHTNYDHSQFMFTNKASLDISGSSSNPAFSTNPTFPQIYPTIGNPVGSSVQHPPYNHGNQGEIMPYGFGEASGSRVEPDQGSDEENQAHNFHKMSQDNYGRGKHS